MNRNWYKIQQMCSHSRIFFAYIFQLWIHLIQPDFRARTVHFIIFICNISYNGSVKVCSIHTLCVLSHQCGGVSFHVCWRRFWRRGSWWSSPWRRTRMTKLCCAYWMPGSLASNLLLMSHSVTLLPASQDECLALRYSTCCYMAF